MKLASDKKIKSIPYEIQTGITGIDAELIKLYVRLYQIMPESPWKHGSESRRDYTRCNFTICLMSHF